MQYEQFRQFRFGKKVAPFAFATDRITKRATIIPSARVCENSSLAHLSSRTPVRDLAIFNYIERQDFSASRRNDNFHTLWRREESLLNVKFSPAKKKSLLS